MRTHRKYLPFLYLFLGSLLPLLLYVIIVNPEGKVALFGADIGSPLLLFILIFLSLFALFTFILANKRRGALFALFLDGVLLLRFFGFRSFFQIIVLFVIILLIEFLYSRRPPHKAPNLV